MCKPVETKHDDKSQAGAQAWARIGLIAANFFAETNRMEPLVAIYLIEAKNWDVVWVGYVSVVMNVIMIVFQTPAGDFIDKTRHKRVTVAASLVVASITTAAVAWTSELYAIILVKAVEGIAATMFLPGLVGLLFAIVPGEDAPRMISHTEVSNKIGSVLFTVGTGFIAYYLYPNVQSVFYLLGVGGLAAAASIIAIPGSTIDHNRARGGAAEDDELKETKPKKVTGEDVSKDEEFEDEELAKELVSQDPAENEELAEESVSQDSAESGGKTEAWGYRRTLADRKIATFAFLTFTYHLCNAAVLPLLAQLIAHEDKRTGLAFASAIMCLTFFVQAPTAYLVGHHHKRFGYKTLLMAAHVILPVRCATCALLAIYYPNQYALAATQIFEGLGAGIYDTILPLVVGSLVQGSGRFGVTFGVVLTSWRLGHGFSLLIGEAILKAADHRYEAPFLAFCAGGVLCCILLVFGVSLPPPEAEMKIERTPTLIRNSQLLVLDVDETEDLKQTGGRHRSSVIGVRGTVRRASLIPLHKSGTEILLNTGY